MLWPNPLYLSCNRSMTYKHNLIGVFLFLAIHAVAISDALEVTAIEISGQRKTKDVVILRELDFTIGDTISLAELAQRLDRNRTNLLNTALFTEAELNISEWDHDVRQIVVSIVVKEAWYLYIVPIVELADRNFNVWWEEHNHAFERLNLGISAQHINLTGVRDRLKIKGQVGYTPKFEVNYQLPYFNRDKSLGINCNIFWSSNKEVAYLSEGNKQIFYKDESASVFRRFRLQAGTRYRPNLYMNHELDFFFHSNKVDPTIALDNNPDFFLNRKVQQNYFALRYKWTYDARDIQLFPTRGLLCGMEVIKEGLGTFDDVNNLSVSPFFEYHFTISKKISFAALGKGQYGIIRKKPPYWNYQALGYGRDYIRGYELYIINGLDFAYAKTGIKARLIDSKLNWKKKMPKVFREMSYQLFLTLNYDIGYVNDPFYYVGNPLVNSMISGGGPGIALVIYHTFALHIEYNRNHLGENGLFLHTKTSF